jgi:uncharacterized protein (TIRG00374 family)
VLISRRHAQIAGILVGLATLVLVGYLIGFTDIVATLRTLSARQTLALVGVGLVPLVLWGLALWLVLDAIGAPAGVGRATLLFCVSLFFNSVTPFGQAGGAPLSGGVIAHAVETPYERALAAIGSLNAVNTLVTLCLWLVGGAALVTTDGATGAREATAVAAAGLVVTGVAVVLAWRTRRWLTERVSAALALSLAAVARPVPGWTPPDPAAVAARVDGFVAAIERLAASHRHLVGVVCLVTAGQLTVVLVLYLALSFFQHPSLVAVLFVVPLSRTGTVVPTPGGIGSSEALLSGLLVSVAGATPAIAGATAVLYRVTAFWIPALVGGVAAAGLLFESRR